MRIGIVGTGNVGCACATAAVTRGSARTIVLVNRTHKTAEAVATDLRYGTPLGPKLDIACPAALRARNLLRMPPERTQALRRQRRQ
jgi:predicted dinucleotide-binding enzyme